MNPVIVCLPVPITPWHSIRPAPQVTAHACTAWLEHTFGHHGTHGITWDPGDALCGGKVAGVLHRIVNFTQ